MKLPLANRQAVGRELAEALQGYAGRKEVVILALSGARCGGRVKSERVTSAMVKMTLIRFFTDGQRNPVGWDESCRTG